MSDENRLLATELARNLAGLKEGRDEALRALGETQVGLHSMLRHEAVRQRARGREDRARALEARADSSLDVIGRLETERQRLRIAVPAVAGDDALVHGRVRDPAGHGLPGLTVRLVDSKDQPVPGAPSAVTDESGYYAIVLSPKGRPDPGSPGKPGPGQDRSDRKSPASDTPATGARVYVAVLSANGRLLHREKQPLDLAPGSRHFVDVTLDPRGLAGKKGGKTARGKEAGRARGAAEATAAEAKRKRPRRRS